MRAIRLGKDLILCFFKLIFVFLLKSSEYDVENEEGSFLVRTLGSFDAMFSEENCRLLFTLI